MKKIISRLSVLFLAVLIWSVSPWATQLRADYTYHDDRDPPGDPEAHTYHVHVDHYYYTIGPYLEDEYSWTEDYDVTEYTSPGDTIDQTDHIEETSGYDGDQYYYSWNSFSYS
ncbi:MAG TPA: hypothetical protein VHD62_19605 [Opitutaceae bacterium]|nr:hypothetical protein [Opitutaceae bacterium]